MWNITNDTGELKQYFKTVVLILKLISFPVVIKNYGKLYMPFHISVMECFQLVNLKSSKS